MRHVGWVSEDEADVLVRSFLEITRFRNRLGIFHTIDRTKVTIPATRRQRSTKAHAAINFLDGILTNVCN